MQEAEGHLDDFWDGLEELCVELASKRLSNRLANTLPRRDISRTPDWVEIPKETQNTQKSNKEEDVTEAVRELELRSEAAILLTVTHNGAQRRSRPEGSLPHQPTILLNSQSPPRRSIKLLQLYLSANAPSRPSHPSSITLTPPTYPVKFPGQISYQP